MGARDCTAPSVGETLARLIPQHERERIRSDVDSFVRDFPMIAPDGSFDRKASRADRARYRLAMIKEQRKHLDYEEMLLLQIAGRPDGRR